jgi:hypothetical protein
MAPQEEELQPENTSGYKLSQPKQSLAEYQKMGKFKREACNPALFLFPDSACQKPTARDKVWMDSSKCWPAWFTTSPDPSHSTRALVSTSPRLSLGKPYSTSIYLGCRHAPTLGEICLMALFPAHPLVLPPSTCLEALRHSTFNCLT